MHDTSLDRTLSLDSMFCILAVISSHIALSEAKLCCTTDSQSVAPSLGEGSTLPLA